jgi:hypothetical protein
MGVLCRQISDSSSVDVRTSARDAVALADLPKAIGARPDVRVAGPVGRALRLARSMLSCRPVLLADDASQWGAALHIARAEALELVVECAMVRILDVEQLRNVAQRQVEGELVLLGREGLTRVLLWLCPDWALAAAPWRGRALLAHMDLGGTGQRLIWIRAGLLWPLT